MRKLIGALIILAVVGVILSALTKQWFRLLINVGLGGFWISKWRERV